MGAGEGVAEEEWIESPDGWGSSESAPDGSGAGNDDDNDDDDDDERPLDIFADPDPCESFDFRFRRRRIEGTNAEDPDSDIVVRLAGYKLDTDETAKSTGVTLWGAAPVLANFLCRRSEDETNNDHAVGEAVSKEEATANTTTTIKIGGCKVLELGAGLGLPGIVASRLGASEVVLTDADTHALEKMRGNVAANIQRRNNNEEHGIACRQLNWNDPLPFREAHGTFDLILAADVIYVPESVGPLFDTVDALLKGGGSSDDERERDDDNGERGVVETNARCGGRGNGVFVLCWLTRWNDVPEELVLNAARDRRFLVSRPEEGIFVMTREEGGEKE